MLSYLFPLGLSVVNVIFVVVAFGDSLKLVRKQLDDDGAEDTSGRNRSAMKEVQQVLKLRSLWIISLFYFLHLGVAFAAGGKLLSIAHQSFSKRKV